MTPPPVLAQLELVLRQLLHEHATLLQHLVEHEAALRSCSLDRIERASRDQDLARQRIALVESKRRVLTHQLGRQLRHTAPPTLAQLADAYPDRKLVLIQIRSELATIAAQIQEKSALLARVAQSVLGHVNATLRLVAKATTGPGTYTRNGVDTMPGRIGVLNAVA